MIWDFVLTLEILAGQNDQHMRKIFLFVLIEFVLHILIQPKKWFQSSSEQHGCTPLA